MRESLLICPHSSYAVMVLLSCTAGSGCTVWVWGAHSGYWAQGRHQLGAGSTAGTGAGGTYSRPTAGLYACTKILCKSSWNVFRFGPNRVAADMEGNVRYMCEVQ